MVRVAGTLMPSLLTAQQREGRVDTSGCLKDEVQKK